MFLYCLVHATLLRQVVFALFWAVTNAEKYYPYTIADIFHYSMLAGSICDKRTYSHIKTCDNNIVHVSVAEIFQNLKVTVIYCNI